LSRRGLVSAGFVTARFVAALFVTTAGVAALVAAAAAVGVPLALLGLAGLGAGGVGVVRVVPVVVRLLLERVAVVDQLALAVHPPLLRRVRAAAVGGGRAAAVAAAAAVVEPPARPAGARPPLAIPPLVTRPADGRLPGLAGVELARVRVGGQHRAQLGSMTMPSRLSNSSSFISSSPRAGSALTSTCFFVRSSRSASARRFLLLR
jgi:hypothetical protein